MDKIIINIVINLLFWTNVVLAQFNTASCSFVTKGGVKEKFIPPPVKPDSLEWMNNWDSNMHEVKQLDSVSEGDNTNISLPLKHIELTSNFGYRIHPVDKVTMFHAGIDLEANYEPFYCFADGIVLRTGYDERAGNYVVISHGKLETVYCHLSQIWVKQKETVCTGQLLGITGNSGKTTGPHLHFGMRWDNEPINPVKIIVYVIALGYATLKK